VLVGDGNSVKTITIVLLCVLLLVEGVIFYRIARDNFDSGLAREVAPRAARAKGETVPMARRIDRPLPRPSALPAGGSQATPAESPGLWFSNDDYPAEARRHGEEGRVVIALDIGVDGRVRACRVTGSSGSASLDATTCALASRRGRYNPARSATGTPIASTVVLPGVRWRLEE